MLQVFNVFMKDMDCGKDWLLWQPEAAQRPEVRAFLNWIRLDIAAEPAAAVAG